MCKQDAHRYTIEVTGGQPRYVGTDRDEAVRALAGLSDNDPGYAVAEHDLGDSTAYCRPETQLVECAAFALTT